MDTKGNAIRLLRRLWSTLPKGLRKKLWQARGWWYPYQSIIYGGRILRAGTDRSETYRIIFPSPPIGKTVLDVGCHSGFYCFMAASEGAAYCLGIDADARHLSRGRAVAQRHRISGLKFIHADVLKYQPDSQFDVVLCLNVLQHMSKLEHVESLLTKLLRSAREDLVLIFPFAKDSTCTHAYERRDGVPYLLLSSSYITQLCGGWKVLANELPDHLYGPDRLIVRISRRVP